MSLRIPVKIDFSFYFRSILIHPFFILLIVFNLIFCWFHLLNSSWLVIFFIFHVFFLLSKFNQCVLMCFNKSNETCQSTCFSYNLLLFFITHFDIQLQLLQLKCFFRPSSQYVLFILHRSSGRSGSSGLSVLSQLIQVVFYYILYHSTLALRYKFVY